MVVYRDFLECLYLLSPLSFTTGAMWVLFPDGKDGANLLSQRPRDPHKWIVMNVEFHFHISNYHYGHSPEGCGG